MLSGPFRIEVSERAEIIEANELSEMEHKCLLDGFKFDPEKHYICRFFVYPKGQEPSKNAKNRIRKKKSFERVDRIYVDVSAQSRQLSFCGMYPRAYTEGRGWHLDFEGDASMAPLSMGRVGLKLSGSLKNVFSRSDQIVWAHRRDREAQWILKRVWIDRGNELRFELTCIVAKDSSQKEKFLLCNVKFAERDRSIARVRDRRVYLP